MVFGSSGSVALSTLTTLLLIGAADGAVINIVEHGAVQGDPPLLPIGTYRDGAPIADTLIRRASAVVDGLRRVSNSAWVYPSCGEGAGLG